MNEKEQVVLLSHYDLDAAGVNVLADHIWDVKARRNQGYAKIRKSLDYLIDKYSDKIRTIVIADLKIEPEDLLHAIDWFDKVYYYDHHESSEEFVSWQEKYPGFECHFDLTKCSTALVWLDGVKNKGAQRTTGLDTFMQTVNTYDMWNQKSIRWSQAVLLNDMFWRLNMDDFRERFKDGLWHFTPQELIEAEEENKRREEIIEEATIEKMDTGSTVVVMNDSTALNYVSTKLDGDIFYIITTDRMTNNISVRVKDSNPVFNINKGIMNLQGKYPDVVQSGGGHISAGGITFQGTPTINQIVDFLYDNDAYIRQEATV